MPELHSLGAIIASGLIASIAFSSPASADSRWHDQAWRDMRTLASVGSSALGRTSTLVQIQRTCDYLDDGFSAEKVFDLYYRTARKSAYDQQQLRDMIQYNMALMMVAGKRACPRHQTSIARGLGF